MKLSEGIEALLACLEKFGDVEFKFATSTDGNPALELDNVDSTVPVQNLDADEERIRRFNARFPIKDIWIPGRS